MRQVMSDARIDVMNAEKWPDQKGAYSDLLYLHGKVREKVQLILAYRQFTAMDPATRLQTIHRASTLVRSAQIEIARNEMFSLLQQML